MAKVIAINTIHRLHPTRKGEQEVIAPNTEFESSGVELEGLKKQDAVKVIDEKPAGKSGGKSAKAGTQTAAKTEAKTEAPAGSGNDGLGDL